MPQKERERGASTNRGNVGGRGSVGRSIHGAILPLAVHCLCCGNMQCTHMNSANSVKS